jgi:membrane-associated phospholipid phosphatase
MAAMREVVCGTARYGILWLALWAGLAHGEPNFNGETGYINMPDGRIEADGTFRMGYSFAEPYSSIWTSVALLPRVEVYARYVRIMHTPAKPGVVAWQNYGDYKDKVFSGKVLLLEEDWHIPSLVFGMSDMQGTGLFVSKYLAASKQFGALDTTLGIGTGRISGMFGGARYAPKEWDGLALVAEYDANNYKQDWRSTESGAADRKKGIGLALEYRWGWLGSQLSYRDGKPGINAYASVPLEMKEFIPKFEEPAPDTEVVARPTIEQWRADPQYQRGLTKRLLDQDFKNIRIKVSEHAIEAMLTNTRISLPSRAVGRAARSILLRAPLGIREIKIHYTVADLPFATYNFFDADRLQRYFNGAISRKQLAPYVAIDYAEPQHLVGNDAMLDGLEEEYFQTYLDGEDGDVVSFRGEGSGLDRIRVAPGLGIYFNDPSGALRYEVFANASIEKQAGEGLFLKAATQLTIKQNVSGVTQPSNSLLPHVRTDVADYKKNGNIKLTQLLANQFFHPGQRVYARASAGLYEEMFGGAGGQVLYYPERAPWAFDLSVDALQQRDVGGGFAFRNYSTVTALGALHYRLPITGVTATVRGGRFLAGDLGARFEMKRQFRSGFQVGAWYSLTDGNDITSPGTPAKPYHDKGVFMSIPLGSMLTKDTQAAPKMSISPWTRDVAQMVASPGDLYDIMEPGYVNMRDRDGLQYFGDLDDSYDQPRNPTVLDRIMWSNLKDDGAHVMDGLASADTWLKAGLGLGIAALSSPLDRPADRWAVRHKNGKFSRVAAGIGNNLPLVVGGMAGLLVLDSSDERMSAISFTALEAGVAGVLASEAGKRLVGRSRPQVGKGHRDFNPMQSGSGGSGFPSGHATAMWALVTPYAKEYHAPWLYGLAAVTNVARVLDRKHWVSDTVGGALLGYALGDAFWRWHRQGERTLTLDGDGVTLTWRTD